MRVQQTKKERQTQMGACFPPPPHHSCHDVTLLAVFVASTFDFPTITITTTNTNHHHHHNHHHLSSSFLNNTTSTTNTTTTITINY
ncbi:hypothetical protein E2C01_032604 [Portunus trituberculatus]|uniref:Uncharacterized protein n=1 Tax=Portunus trituberculatus TaxID=210409 RepID=A0A5B7F391_PORTR|nr:hypothetical protein [Portunus trituberculatus]